MLEDAAPAVIAQLRKLLEVVETHAPGTVEAAQQLEFQLAATMLRDLFVHRQPGSISDEEAHELLTALAALQRAYEAHGIDVAREDACEVAEQLLSSAKPATN